MYKFDFDPLTHVGDGLDYIRESNAHHVADWEALDKPEPKFWEFICPCCKQVRLDARGAITQHICSHPQHVCSHPQLICSHAHITRRAAGKPVDVQTSQATAAALPCGRLNVYTGWWH